MYLNNFVRQPKKKSMPSLDPLLNINHRLISSLILPLPLVLLINLISLII